MFNEIEFEKIKRLPKYVFASVNEVKMRLRQEGQDIIDFSMGNPDGPTPKHIVDKLVETAQKERNHGYSVSKGIYKLRLAAANWYKRKYGVTLDPDTQIVATMGSKEGYVHLVQAITNPGDVAVVPDPCYPIHSQAFILSGANVQRFKLEANEDTSLNQESFFSSLEEAFNSSSPKPKFVVVNFPNNPTTYTVDKAFYQRLVDMARQKRFYIISDIAYAEITYGGYTTPSILEIEGATDVAVETYTLSKTYNMAGWRVGFVVGNKKLIEALIKIKSWLDYGMFTPIQVAATIALDDDQTCISDLNKMYQERQNVLLESFANAGWHIARPKASMFVWAKIPQELSHLGSLEFSTQLLIQASSAVSPGIGFGPHGDEFVRIALIENPNRIRQAARNIKKYFKENGIKTS